MPLSSLLAAVRKAKTCSRLGRTTTAVSPLLLTNAVCDSHLDPLFQKTLITIFLVATGTLPKLPGNNPVQEEGTHATPLKDANPPRFIEPVYVYRGDKPDKVGQPVGSMPTPPTTGDGDDDGEGEDESDNGSGSSPPVTGTPGNGSCGTTKSKRGHAKRRHASF